MLKTWALKNLYEIAIAEKDEKLKQYLVEKCGYIQDLNKRQVSYVKQVTLL